MRLAGSISAAVALVLGLSGRTVTTAPAAFKVEALTTPAPLDSGELRLAASGDRALLSWIEHAGRKSALKYAERTATGWSAPIAVPPASGAGLVVNAADVPLVQPLKNGQLAAVWTYEQPKNREALSVGLSWSKDNGRTWVPATTPHRDNTETEHSFGGLFDLAAGGFGVIWLDGRAMNGGKDDADMALWGTTYGADGKPGPEMSVDARVCECCQTATAVTSDGPIVAYRDRSAGEIRDVALARLSAGKWSAPAVVHADNWKIDGCPVNGPAVDASGRTVAVAWFTAVGGKGQVFIAFSQDAGRTFGRPVRVDDGAGAGRVQVALLPDGAAVTWVESTNPGSQIRLRRVASDGTRGPSVTVADGAGTQYPRMARRGEELLLAWAEQTRGGTRVRTARASLK